MKKKLWIPLLVLALAVVLFMPIPRGVYEDGGTREYAALTYKIVDWNRMYEGGVYEKTVLYLPPDSFRSVDSLWAQEQERLGKKLVVLVEACTEAEVVVTALEDGSRYRIARDILKDVKPEVGACLELRYTGALLYSDPAVITNVVSCREAADFRPLAYTELWIDKTAAQKQEGNIFEHITITRIYSNCFFARTVIPMPYEIKLNGELSDDWCVGDQVSCKYENTWYDDKNHRVEADLLAIEPSDWTPDPMVAYKPVIYLYPETQTQVSVKLDPAVELTCTYPGYDSGWDVTAFPDGTLTDDRGQSYSYLYWEGILDTRWDLSRGFCVRGADTAAFLETALEQLGLTRREANEFIVYWLPVMQGNPYNVISFQKEAYTDAAGLEIIPKPDTLIRVFMTWQPSEEYVELEPQELKAPERNGFTVVEWGGAKIE